MSLAEAAFRHAQEVVKERQQEYNRRNFSTNKGGDLPRAVRHAIIVQQLNARKQRDEPKFVEPVPLVNPLASILQAIEAIRAELTMGASPSALARQLLQQIEALPLTAAQMYELQAQLYHHSMVHICIDRYNGHIDISNQSLILHKS